MPAEIPSAALRRGVGAGVVVLLKSLLNTKGAVGDLMLLTEAENPICVDKTWRGLLRNPQ